jgi:hypothetical protein
MWLKGEGNEVEIPEGFETVEYTDPFSGKTYVASYDPTEFDPNEPIDPRTSIPSTDGAFLAHTHWPAAQMIATAANMIFPDEYGYSDLQQLVGRLEILRNVYKRYEYND